jgi:hypothetical protein
MCNMPTRKIKTVDYIAPRVGYDRSIFADWTKLQYGSLYCIKRRIFPTDLDFRIGKAPSRGIKFTRQVP